MGEPLGNLMASKYPKKELSRLKKIEVQSRGVSEPSHEPPRTWLTNELMRQAYQAHAQVQAPILIQFEFKVD